MANVPQPLEPDRNLPARLQRTVDPQDLTLSEERDLETFRHLGRCRALTSDMIVQLVGTPGVGDQRLRKRLKELFEHGYLDRPQQQQVHTIKPGGRWGGAMPLVYALGRRGAQAIAREPEFAGLDGKRLDRNNREIKDRQIQHSLLVSGDVEHNPDRYLKAPRPPLLKDYFDARLRKVVQVPRKNRLVRIQFGAEQSDVPAT